MHPVSAETLLKSRDEMNGAELALHTLIQDLQKRMRTLENRMYKVERQPVGEQPDGTFAVPAMPKNGASASPETPAPASGKALVDVMNGSAFCTGNRTTELAHSGWALSIREQTQAVIDIYSDCCRYASARHGDIVSRDDVRSLLMNRLIGAGRR